MKVVLLTLILLTLNSCTAPTIEGIWKNEKDPKLIWEFNASGQLIEKYGDESKTSPSMFQILDYSHRCNDGTTDLPEQLYLKITDVELGSFCYYLETLSEEVLVLINTDTGRMLIFNKVN